MMKNFIQKSLFFLLSMLSTISALRAEDADYRAITLTHDQFLEFIDRKPEPAYIPIKQKIIPTKGFCYVPAIVEIELSNAWGVWLIFDFDSWGHFQMGEEVWLVAMTEEEKDVYPSKQAHFNSLYGEDIVEDYPFTHWIIPKTGLFAFPALNTPTELHIKLMGWDY